ncbi:DUF4383 domain-containing protein [Streptomyces sp. 8K308]|uniref:DUF4383 domain-containing protein n=1 Tax=Streptomyces sp. 8K308 TaxID=2530388 RepID=UPI0010461D92|nr:DUF4383 domain-containing protein [Streptomyces sp. 8K308]TDC18714.1 DUF4383 domain-containing protein [Streptomyces sp. 8K308]
MRSPLDTRGEPRLPHGGPRSLLKQAVLDERQPAHRRLNMVYRVGAGLMGIGFVVFGFFGLFSSIGLFATGNNAVFGLNSNGALSWLSIAVGLLLFVGMLKGGHFASTLNLVLGVLFVLSGFVNLAILRTDLNFLNFRIQNVIFSFVVGLVLLAFGTYGRFAGRLPHDNPYWGARHPRTARTLSAREREVERRRLELNDALVRERELRERAEEERRRRAA